MTGNIGTAMFCLGEMWKPHETVVKQNIIDCKFNAHMQGNTLHMA